MTAEKPDSTPVLDELKAELLRDGRALGNRAGQVIEPSSAENASQRREPGADPRG
jgi:hypothetical protein